MTDDLAHDHPKLGAVTVASLRHVHDADGKSAVIEQYSPARDTWVYLGRIRWTEKGTETP